MARFLAMPPKHFVLQGCSIRYVIRRAKTMVYDDLDDKDIDLNEQARRYNEEMSYYEGDSFGERINSPEDEAGLEEEEDQLENDILADTNSTSTSEEGASSPHDK
jgi:hypothetical protein